MNKPVTKEEFDLIEIDAALAAEKAEKSATKRKRKKLFAGLAAAIAVTGGAYHAYDVLIGSHHVETDNAYVGADIAQVTPQVGGPVREVLVQDAQQVRRGQILVRLDDTDARIALARAEAELEAAERRVRSLVASDGEHSAQIAARAADASGRARRSARLAAMSTGRASNCAAARAWPSRERSRRKS